MRRINFSENKNGRLPFLIPFQMFRFMPFSMSASFFPQNFGTEMYFHFINDQLGKKEESRQDLFSKEHVFRHFEQLFQD